MMTRPAGPWALFSKHVQKLPLEAALAGVEKAGLDGLDLTVRNGGHVEPERVEDELPKLVAAVRARGLDVPMISTDIVSASDPLARRTLSAAKASGIKLYKMGYFRHGEFGGLKTIVETARRAFSELAELNAELGVAGVYHNHCDDFFGAGLWEIHEASKDIPPDLLGFYFDPCHAVAEGGCLGWRLGLELLSERVRTLAVKDFRWVDGNYRYAGARRHSVEFCPLAQGNVPWDKVAAALEAIGFKGTVSFHSEYQGTHSFADLTAQEVLEQTAADVSFFKAITNWRDE